jgi:hypothetical protein
MPDQQYRQMVDAAYEKGLQTTAGRQQRRASNQYAQNVAKQSASQYTRANAASKASKAAKLAKLTRVTPVGLVVGAAVEKGATKAADYGRRKFVEADMKKMKKINAKGEALNKAFEAAREKRKKK